MANGNPASFFPVIGSGFPDVMAQQRGWALTNLDVQNQNFARAAQAEQAQNSWLEQLARLQRSDEEGVRRQQQLDQAALERQQEIGISQADKAYQRQVEAQATAEDKRRFQIQQDLNQKALERAQQKEQDVVDVADTVGEQLAPRVSDVGKQLQQATQDYNSAIADIDKAGAQLASNTPGSRYDTKTRSIVKADPKAIDPELDKSIAAANASLADHRAAFDTAKTEHDDLQKQLATLDAQIQQQGLLRLPDFSILNPHPRSKKKFGGIKGEMPKTVPTPQPEVIPYFTGPNTPKLFSAEGTPLTMDQFTAANPPTPNFFPPTPTQPFGTNLPQTFTQTTQSDRVRVRAPDGRIGNIPQTQLQAALNMGYTLVQ